MYENCKVVQATKTERGNRQVTWVQVTLDSQIYYVSLCMPRTKWRCLSMYAMVFHRYSDGLATLATVRPRMRMYQRVLRLALEKLRKDFA